jgi:uncharacterized protein (DUF1015 family)
MLLDGAWYRLVAREETLSGEDPLQSLDVSVLQERLLGPILGVSDPRTDPRVEFIGGSRAPEKIERRCTDDMRVGFMLHPLRVEQLMAVADRGEILPPKSTWFEPKLLSGLVVRTFDGGVS